MKTVHNQNNTVERWVPTYCLGPFSALLITTLLAVIDAGFVLWVIPAFVVLFIVSITNPFMVSKGSEWKFYALNHAFVGRPLYVAKPGELDKFFLFVMKNQISGSNSFQGMLGHFEWVAQCPMHVLEELLGEHEKAVKLSRTPSNYRGAPPYLLGQGGKECADSTS